MATIAITGDGYAVLSLCITPRSPLVPMMLSFRRQPNELFGGHIRAVLTRAKIHTVSSCTSYTSR